jgi:hypothetical protein
LNGGAAKGFVMSAGKRGSVDIVGSFVRGNPIGSLSFAFDVGVFAAMVFRLLKNRNITGAKILELVPLVPSDTPLRRVRTAAPRRAKTVRRSRKAA